MHFSFVKRLFKIKMVTLLMGHPVIIMKEYFVIDQCRLSWWKLGWLLCEFTSLQRTVKSRLESRKDSFSVIVVVRPGLIAKLLKYFRFVIIISAAICFNIISISMNLLYVNVLDFMCLDYLSFEEREAKTNLKWTYLSLLCLKSATSRLPNVTFTELRGFHGAFATGVACQQGALTLPDTWFRPPFWDLLMLQLLRPNSSNLPCLYSTLHLEYPLVLSRFCFTTLRPTPLSFIRKCLVGF